MTNTNEQIIPTGYTELDKLLDGGLRKDGSFITCTSNFDSSIATRFVLNFAGKFLRNTNYEKSVLFFLMDSSIFRKDEMLMCLHIDPNKFNRFEIIDWDPNTSEMKQVIKKYKCLSNLGLVIVDDIDHCKTDSDIAEKHGSEFDIFLSMIALKQITCELNIPVLAVKQPMNSDSFRDVSRFADIILDMSRTSQGLHISATKIKKAELILQTDSI